MSADNNFAPLRGLRVLDLSQNLAGPYCTQILGDLGAEITKVEPPNGDAARAWGPPFWNGDSTLFLSTNRNKTSITCDLRNDEDVARIKRDIAYSDVFVQALRPGALDAIGLGPQQLMQEYPRLIYVSISAYGEAGPRKNEAGYDPLMQAHAGLMSVTGQPHENARIGTSIVDMGTGMWTAIGVLAALRERDSTGRGTHVHGALFDTALAWNAYHIMGYLAGGVVPQPAGMAFPLIVPYDAYPTSDGRIMIAAANDALFARLCDALQLHELRDDEQFKTNPQRVAAREHVNDAVSAATRKHTSDNLLQLLRDAKIPCAPIQNIAEVVTDEQTIASGMVQKIGMEGAPDYTAVAMPLRFDGVRPRADGLPPRRTRRE